MNSPYQVTWHWHGGTTNQARTLVEGLSKQCAKKYEKLKRNLSFMGPQLAHTEMFGHIDGDIWELRELCDSGALRIYLFRDGNVYYLATAEIKNNGRNQANSSLIKKAQECCDEHKRSRG